MARERRNDAYLPGVPFPEPLEVTTQLDEALRAAEDVLVVVPSHAFRETLQRIGDADVKPRYLSWATKGFETASGLLPHQVASRMLDPGVPTAVDLRTDLRGRGRRRPAQRRDHRLRRRGKRAAPGQCHQHDHVSRLHIVGYRRSGSRRGNEKRSCDRRRDIRWAGVRRQYQDRHGYPGADGNDPARACAGARNGRRSWVCRASGTWY